VIGGRVTRGGGPSVIRGGARSVVWKVETSLSVGDGGNDEASRACLRRETPQGEHIAHIRVDEERKYQKTSWGDKNVAGDGLIDFPGGSEE
jgi:hypothetical protein